MAPVGEFKMSATIGEGLEGDRGDSAQGTSTCKAEKLFSEPSRLNNPEQRRRCFPSKNGSLLISSRLSTVMRKFDHLGDPPRYSSFYQMEPHVDAVLMKEAQHTLFGDLLIRES